EERETDRLDRLRAGDRRPFELIDRSQIEALVEDVDQMRAVRRDRDRIPAQRVELRLIGTLDRKARDRLRPLDRLARAPDDDTGHERGGNGSRVRRSAANDGRLWR